MIDPRDERKAAPEDVLTEDSDDALADLEKEFMAKKQKLLEERARKLERKTKLVQVERSPSPPRRNTEVIATLPSKKAPQTHQPSRNTQPSVESAAVPRNTFRKASRPLPTSEFASRLYDSKEESGNHIDYNGRVFEFENIPLMAPQQTTSENCVDPISGEVLSRRYYSQQVAEKLLGPIKVLRAPKLLAKVVPPRFEEPHYDNWCFTGIVMHKSDPKTSVNNKKFMALRVGNFHHTVDVIFFGDAFHKYWKVRAGDVVVMLNPTVKKFGKSFNLSLLDDLDSMLELGTAKNYGHCLANTAQGNPCKNVVDKLQNDLCTFHEESKFKAGSRMELQGSVKPKGPQNLRGEASELYVNGSTSQPMFVQYANAGFYEKDLVFSGGHQFDQSRYDRPVESKASKLRKQRANAKLEKQLLETVAPRHLDDLATLGILPNKRTVEDQQLSARKVRKHAFNSTFITGMGFDPTLTKNRPGCESKSGLAKLQELRQLSQAKKISLQPSNEDNLKRQDKWRNAMKITKKPEKLARLPKLGSGNRIPPTINISDHDDSGDSDIEITFTKDMDRLEYEDARCRSSDMEKRGRA